MDKIAENGIASHWSYKEKKKANAKIRNQNYYMEDIRRFADQVKRRVAKHINESVNR